MYRIIGGDHQEYGPATEDEIRQWITEGRLSAESLAREDESSQWRKLGTFREFDEALRTQAGAAQPDASVPPPLQAVGLGMPVGLVDVRGCLGRGWRLLAANLSLIFAATFLVWTLELISQFLPVLSVVYWTLEGVFYGGLSLLTLKRIRGEPAGVGDVFAGFSLNFAHLALVGMVASVLTRIGLLLFVLPGIYLTVAWAFSIPLAADKQMAFWPAMETSRRVVTRQWGQVFVLLVIAFLPALLMHLLLEIQIARAMLGAMKEIFGTVQPGMNQVFEKMPELLRMTAERTFHWVLIAKGVLLLNLPFALGAVLHAYEELFGAKTKAGP